MQDTYDIINADRMQQLFGADDDTLSGFSFKSFLKQAEKVVKQAAPVVVGAVATVYGGPAAGAAAYGLTSGLLNKGGGGGEVAYAPEQPPAAVSAPSGAPSTGGGGIVIAGVALLALVALAGKKR